MGTASVRSERGKQQPSRETRPCHVKYWGQTRERELQAVACRSGLAPEAQGTVILLGNTKLPYGC